MPIDGTAAKADRDSAEELNAQGLTATRAGKLEEAEALFEKAFALKRTHDIAANLGLVELKLGKASEAAEHMTFALRYSPPSDSDEMRKRIRQRLEEALAFAGTLRVKAGMAAHRCG
jgi:tetratricopeptide (TPR) repeat protein